ncbi:MAG TPA: hypothetical protein VJA21_19960 [Verrucomicrobiae bacterium]
MKQKELDMEKLRNKIPIVGVVGPTGRKNHPVPKELLDVALELGSEGSKTAPCGLIVLTGGEYISSPKHVKEAALKGAIEAGAVGKPGRGIGILAGHNEVPLIIKREREGNNPLWKCLYGYTGLLKHQRNVLNGYLPGAIIALGGAAGTLSEVAFAAYAETPLVFLNSLSKLQDVRKSNEKELREILKEAVNICPEFDPESGVVNILQKLDEALISGQSCNTAKAAVESATRRAAAAGGAGNFPNIPTLAFTRAEFLAKLESLNSND